MWLLLILSLILPMSNEAGPLSQLADDPGSSVGGGWLMIGEEEQQLQNQPTLPKRPLSPSDGGWLMIGDEQRQLQNPKPTLPKSEHHRHRHLLKFSSHA